MVATGGPLTRREIRRRWPEWARKPDEVTLWRWLERLVAEEAVVRVGSGRRNDPYRFRRADEEGTPG
jgi:hypothetical protein